MCLCKGRPLCWTPQIQSGHRKIPLDGQSMASLQASPVKSRGVARWRDLHPRAFHLCPPTPLTGQVSQPQTRHPFLYVSLSSAPVLYSECDGRVTLLCVALQLTRLRWQLVQRRGHGCRCCRSTQMVSMLAICADDTMGRAQPGCLSYTCLL